MVKFNAFEALLVESSNEIRKKAMNAYNQSPKGWKVTVTRDRAGFYNTMIVKRKNIWLLKEQVINPYETAGYGLVDTLDEEPEFDSPGSSFGFRPLKADSLELAQNEEDLKRRSDRLLRETLTRDPVSLNRITTPLTIQGPMVYSDKRDAIFSAHHRDLDFKLKVELEKLISKRHPYLRTTYQ